MQAASYLVVSQALQTLTTTRTDLRPDRFQLYLIPNLYIV
jgi:hypothetical protein